MYSKKLTNKDEKIIDSAKIPKSCKEIAYEIGHSIRYTRTRISRLVKLGLLVRRTQTLDMRTIVYRSLIK